MRHWRIAAHLPLEPFGTHLVNPLHVVNNPTLFFHSKISSSEGVLRRGAEGDRKAPCTIYMKEHLLPKELRFRGYPATRVSSFFSFMLIPEGLNGAIPLALWIPSEPILLIPFMMKASLKPLFSIKYYFSVSFIFQYHNKKIEKSAAGTVARAKPAYHSGSSNFSILRFALTNDGYYTS